VLSSLLSVVLFAGMQLFRPQLAAQEYTTILGGFIGSLLFITSLTAIGNLEQTLFGESFQTKLIEVLLALCIACAASGLVHRVCVTTCILFSLVGLYYLNRLAQRVYAVPEVAATDASVKAKKKRN